MAKWNSFNPYLIDYSDRDLSSHLSGYDNITDPGATGAMKTRIIDPPTPGVALIWVDAHTGWVKCRSPYNSEFVEFLKGQVPAQDRKWIKEERVWAVSDDYLDAMINIAARYFEVRELSVSPVDVARGTVDGIAERTASLRNKIGRKAMRAKEAGNGIPDELRGRRIVIEEVEDVSEGEGGNEEGA